MKEELRVQACNCSLTLTFDHSDCSGKTRGGIATYVSNYHVYIYICIYIYIYIYIYLFIYYIHIHTFFFYFYHKPQIDFSSRTLRTKHFALCCRFFFFFEDNRHKINVKKKGKVSHEYAISFYQSNKKWECYANFQFFGSPEKNFFFICEF